MKKTNSDHLTSERGVELKALEALPEEEINTRDIPEQRLARSAARSGAARPPEDIEAHTGLFA